jgi:hypothetical protein
MFAFGLLPQHRDPIFGVGHPYARVAKPNRIKLHGLTAPEASVIPSKVGERRSFICRSGGRPVVKIILREFL